jgi:hypothetical protein
MRCVASSTLAGLFFLLQLAASVAVACAIGPTACGLVAMAAAAWSVWVVVDCWVVGTLDESTLASVCFLWADGVERRA